MDVARFAYRDSEGYLNLDEIPCSVVKDSQGYAMRQKKGRGVTAAFKLRKLLGKRNPVYDQPFVVPNVGMKDIIKAAMKCCMRLMGKQKWLWPIICKM